MLDSDPAPNSPLARQGLRKGDIITHVDGQPLRSLEDLNRATANSRLTVQKGNETKFAGNLLKNADDKLMKSFEGMQEVEAGTLMSNAQVRDADMDMYKFFEQNNQPVFGVKAIENNGNGVKVTEVLAGMPGQKSGFEINDVILEINGVKITNEQAYSDAIDRAGKVARMVVLCGKTGQTVNADVVLNK
jgi:S1-C subfamily serine protease